MIHGESGKSFKFKVYGVVGTELNKKVEEEEKINKSKAMYCNERAGKGGDRKNGSRGEMGKRKER